MRSSARSARFPSLLADLSSGFCFFAGADPCREKRCPLFRDRRELLLQEARLVRLHALHALQAKNLLDRDELAVDVVDAAILADAGEDLLHGGDRSADRVVAINHHLDLAEL